jgi:glycosyltransferase involved in cell wall biosynthesis
MCEPLVSIIVPVFNADKYLAKTLESALNQTWPNKEIIVVDDGSTDNSLAIAKSFQQAGVQLITQTKKGASAARNAGLKKARGKYIQFLDADDIISINKIEIQVTLLQKYPDYICFCSTVHFKNGTDYKTYSANHDKLSANENSPTKFLIKLYSDVDNMVQPNAWLTPSEVIDKAGLWNENLSVDDDGEFFCRVILASKGVVYTPEALNYYRKHLNRGSLSAQLNLNGLESMLKSIGLKQQYLAANCDLKTVQQIFASHYWNVAFIAYPRFKTLSAQAAKKAKKGNYTGRKYKGGPISNLLSRFLGWRIIRYISYMRYGF